MFGFIKKPKNYISCHALGSRLVFFCEKVAYCSNGNPSKNMVYPTIYNNFKGEKDLNINYLIKHIKNTKKQLKEGIVPSNCLNCPNLYEQETSNIKEKSLISYLQFSDYSLCNSKCIYCNSWNNTKYEDNKYTTKNGNPDSYEIMPIIQQLIKKKIISQDTIIDFAGGEPTLYRQFEEALNYFLNFGTKQIYVFSNIINYSEAIEKGIKDGVIILTVSIDAGTKDIHQIIKGVNSYDDVYNNLTRYNSYKKFPNQVISKYVIVPGYNDDANEISLWIDKSKQIGINKLILNADNRIFEQECDKNIIYKLKELSDFFVKKVNDYNLEYDLYSNIHYVNDYVNNYINEI